jgi:hypothetical protein
LRLQGKKHDLQEPDDADLCNDHRTPPRPAGLGFSLSAGVAAGAPLSLVENSGSEHIFRPLIVGLVARIPPASAKNKAVFALIR